MHVYIFIYLSIYIYTHIYVGARNLCVAASAAAVCARVRCRASAGPQSGIKPSNSIIVICSKSHRIPARACTNQGPQKGDLIVR